MNRPSSPNRPSSRPSMPRRAAALAAALLCGAHLAGTAQAAPPPPPPSSYKPVPPTVARVPADTGTRNHPYLFTQQHRDNLWWWNGAWLPQSVPSGAHVRIQLPGGPVQWKPYTGPDCRTPRVPGLRRLSPARVQYLGRSQLPNADRIDGYSNLQNFDYTVDGTGLARICLRPDPAPTHPEDIGLGNGAADPYVLSLLVGVPQLGVSSQR
ncbi:hypothetical protein [Streptomyces halobius]|uniref:Secreted protein n=1 Tax=Streptomyces halobius TaxID=2879846 RepID=A0ABY4MGZ1_9ACTN|nr:hypothetical protein [Streptomyces halobius]UQA97074.1 hypothetical protein K9S39_39025 [Streptomyces halobius]